MPGRVCECLVHHDTCPVLHSAVKIDDVLVQEPYAASGYRFADRSRIVGAVDAVIGVNTILVHVERTRAHGIARSAIDTIAIARILLGIAFDHAGRRRPSWPGRLSRDHRFTAGKGPRNRSDPDGVAHGFLSGQDKIEIACGLVHDDCSGLLGGRIVDDLPNMARVHF